MSDASRTRPRLHFRYRAVLQMSLAVKTEPAGTIMTRAVDDWDGPGTGFIVTDVVAYPDTLGCLVRYPLPPGLWEQLRSTGSGKVIPAKPLLIGRDLWQLCRIQRPTRDTVDMLANLPRCIVCRVDVAVDFICATAQDACLAGSYFDKFLVQKWHGKRHKRQHKNSVYWNRDRQTARNIALYADKPSKTGMGPCAHVELRFSTAAACRRVGISEPRDLLRDIEVARLLQRQTRLARVDARRFDRLIEQIARKRIRLRTERRRRTSEARLSKRIWDQFNTVDGQCRKTRGLFCRLFQSAERTPTPEVISAQELAERLPRMRSCLISLPWMTAFPQPRWMFLPGLVHVYDWQV